MRRCMHAMPEGPESIQRPVCSGCDEIAHHAGDIQTRNAAQGVNGHSIPDEAQRANEREAYEVFAEAAARAKCHDGIQPGIQPPCHQFTEIAAVGCLTRKRILHQDSVVTFWTGGKQRDWGFSELLDALDVFNGGGRKFRPGTRPSG